MKRKRARPIKQEKNVEKLYDLYSDHVLDTFVSEPGKLEKIAAQQNV